MSKGRDRGTVIAIIALVAMVAVIAGMLVVGALLPDKAPSASAQFEEAPTFGPSCRSTTSSRCSPSRS